MRSHRSTLLWQALPLVLLILITQLAQAAKNNTSRKRRCQSKPVCDGCILVKFSNKSSDDTAHLRHIADLHNRSVAPWKYKLNISPHTLPHTLPEITCATKCVGFETELNAVPIEREIVYLKRKNGIYTLHTKTVIVGCTCVHPMVFEGND